MSSILWKRKINICQKIRYFLARAFLVRCAFRLELFVLLCNRCKDEEQNQRTERDVNDPEIKDHSLYNLFKYPQISILITNLENFGIDDFNSQEYADLMAVFNLVWIDPVHFSRYPRLQELWDKKYCYTKDDRIEILVRL